MIFAGELKGGRENVQTTMMNVFRFVGIPSHDLLEGDVEPRNTRFGSNMNSYQHQNVFRRLC